MTSRNQELRALIGEAGGGASGLESQIKRAAPDLKQCRATLRRMLTKFEGLEGDQLQGPVVYQLHVVLDALDKVGDIFLYRGSK